MPSSDLFHEKLGIERPSQVLVLPVYLNDRVVAMRYTDGGRDGTIRASTDDYLRLGRKLALALQVMLLRQQIVVA